MLSTLLFLIFLVAQLYKIGTFNYTETVQESLLFAELSDTDTVFNISLNETAIASRILNLNPAVLTNNTNTYLAQVFVQETFNGTNLQEQVFYNSVPCPDILS